MVVSVHEALAHIELEVQEEQLIGVIKGIEQLIRDETNNNFQDRRIRFYAESKDGLLYGSSPFLTVGDNIEISESINDGLYTIAQKDDGYFKLDTQLYDIKKNLVTKIVYPESVKKGVLDMLKWEYTMRGKVGIKSESLSRHSVSYFDMDAQNSLAGYPAALVGFLEPYYKARF